MLNDSSFQIGLVSFLFVLFLLTAARRLCKTIIGCEKIGLPSPRKNNTLLYLRWILSMLGNETPLHKKPAILRLISYLSRYKKAGMIHVGIPFINLVILSKPNTAQPLLKNQSTIDKPIFYHFFKKLGGSSVLLSSGDKWRRKRKLLTPAFHLRTLESFIPVIEEASQILVEKLTPSGGNNPVDVVPLMNHSTYKILCETILGLRSSKYDFSALGENIATILDAIEKRLYAIWRWPDVIFRFTENGRKFQRSLEVVKKMANQMIEDRMSQARNEGKKFSEGHQTREGIIFLDVLLSAVSNNSGLTLEDVRDELQIFLFAGHDTTSYSLNWTLHLLGKHPDVQTRLQEEIDEVLGDDQDRLLSSEDLYNLKYTECVIKESMRMYPVIPLIARKTREEISVGNYKIPKGFFCIISIQDIHHDPEIFPCPEKFDPERFLPKNSSGRHPYAFIPFSAGPRNCIGQKLAMLEMKIILARLMQKFTLESLDQNIGLGYRTTLNPSGPVRLQVKKR